MKRQIIHPIICALLIFSATITSLHVHAGPRDPVKKNDGLKKDAPKILSDIDWILNSRYRLPAPGEMGISPLAGYNTTTHRYNDDYVHPTKYGISLTLKLNTADGRGFGNYKFKWQIDGILKQDSTENKFHFSIVTTKKTLFSGPISDLNHEFELIPSLPCTGTFRVTVSVLENDKEIESLVKIIDPKDYLIIAIGDSFSSGEGDPDIYGKSLNPGHCDDITWSELNSDPYTMSVPAIWIEELAHRSFKSPSSKVAAMLEDCDPHSSITFLNFACSGGKVTYGLMKPQHPEWQKEGQIDEAKRTIGNRKIDALIMSIGVNDLSGQCSTCGGASKILQTSADIRKSDIYEGTLIGIQSNRPLTQPSLAQISFNELNNLPALYSYLNNVLRVRLNPTNIFIYEMPTNIFRDKDDVIIEPKYQFSHTSLPEAVIIDRIGYELDLQIQIAAIANHWICIGGILEAFKGHGYMESSDQCWFRAVSTSCKIQGDLDGSLHPTENGHQKVAELAYPLLYAKLIQKYGTIMVPPNPVLNNVPINTK
jgi:hypothetical protein